MNRTMASAGFPQTFDNWIQGLFKDFQGQQQQFSRIYFNARPPLPPLVAICSSHKILYCPMILTFYKLITTMLFVRDYSKTHINSRIFTLIFSYIILALLSLTIAIKKLDDADAEVGQ